MRHREENKVYRDEYEGQEVPPTMDPFDWIILAMFLYVCFGLGMVAWACIELLYEYLFISKPF